MTGVQTCALPICFPVTIGRPDCGTGYTIVDGNEVPNCKIVYCDPVDGNIIINVINMGKEEQVEVQILQQGIVLSDTIYEVE